MARIRTIKPEFFRSEDIGQITPFARLLFIGLWTMADREGRLLDRPRRISIEIFPYDDDFDIETFLRELDSAGLIQRYEADNLRCIQISGFAKHQRPHPKEPPSEIPKSAERKQRASHITTQSRDETLLAVESHDETTSDRVDKGKGKEWIMGREEAASLPPPAPAPQSPVTWHANDWYVQFGKPWTAKYGITHGGGQETAKAIRELGDLLAELPMPERLEAQARAEELFAKYLSGGSDLCHQRKHPFAWFVKDFTALRARGETARAGPPRDHRVGHVRAEDCDHTKTGRQEL